MSLIKKKNIFTIITVRTSSKRLPKKCLKFINKMRVIEIIINRAKKIGYPIILATTKDKADIALCNLAEKNQIIYFKGSKNNVLKRWNDCFIKNKVDVAMMVDADDLLFDYTTYKNAVKILIKKKFDYIRANENSITGLFTYIFNTKVISKIYDDNKKNDIEIIQPYLKKNLKFYSLKLKKDKNIRFTLDYKEDFVFFKKVFSKFPFTVKTIEVIKYLKKFQEIAKVNYFRQKDYLNNQGKKYV